MSETFQQVAERLTNIRAGLDGAIAILTMNRPKALNALNDQTLEELDRIFTCLEREESILGVIITGEGKGFVAGADISQMQSYKSEEGRNYANRAQALFNKIEALEKPVIAAVNGYALGGVASNSPVFGDIVSAMVNLPGPKLLGLVIGTTVIAGICGSASGGLGIAVPILGPVYTQLGIAPSIVHRVMALSSSALDSLPHNGYIVTVTNGLCRETHKDSYGLTFALTVIIPFIGSLVGVALFTLFPNLP